MSEEVGSLVVLYTSRRRSAICADLKILLPLTELEEALAGVVTLP